MAMNPQVLILDEPAAGLDPIGQEEILGGIRTFQRQTGTTVIIVSHSMEDMARYSDEIVVMNNAEVALRGTKDEIFAQADYLCSIGLDVPPVTYLSNKLTSLGLNMGKDCYSVENSLYKLTQILK
jgi:energy-coupling factor transport system ATP-binding protein